MVPGAAPLQEKALARFKAQGAWLDTGQGQQTESHHVQPNRCRAQEPRVIHPGHQHPSPWWQTAPRPRWANPSPACNSWMLHSRYCSGNPALSAVLSPLAAPSAPAPAHSPVGSATGLGVPGPLQDPRMEQQHRHREMIKCGMPRLRDGRGNRPERVLTQCWPRPPGGKLSPRQRLSLSPVCQGMMECRMQAP